MRKFFLALAATLAFAPLAAHSDGPVLQESSFWAQEVNAGSLPHVQDRIPSEPLVVDLEAKGRSFGRQGGTLRTLISRTRLSFASAAASDAAARFCSAAASGADTARSLATSAPLCPRGPLAR